MMTPNWKKPSGFLICIKIFRRFNPFKPEFTIVIIIQYKPQIAVAILDALIHREGLKGEELNRITLICWPSSDLDNVA